MLLRSEVFWVIEDRVPRALHDVSALLVTCNTTLVPHLSTDLVDSFVGPLHDVERVHAEGGPWTATSRDLVAVRRGVEADEFERASPLVSEGIEERFQRRRTFALVCKEEPARVVVDDDGQVAMSAPVADLVNAATVGAAHRASAVPRSARRVARTPRRIRPRRSAPGEVGAQAAPRGGPRRRLSVSAAAPPDTPARGAWPPRPRARRSCPRGAGGAPRG